MENYYQAPYYYSTSPSSSSDLPYSMSQPLQQWQPPQYFEAPPVTYEQVPSYPEYCQQYDTYYPPQCQVPNIPPVVQEEHPIDQYNFSKYPHRQLRRGAYSTFQTNQLTMRFLKSNTISKAERIELAKYINLTERQIKIWFQNQRYEKKKRTKSVESSKPNSYQPY